MPYFDLDPLLETMLDTRPASRISTSPSAGPRRSRSTASSRPVAYAGIERLLPYQTELIAMRLLAGKRDLADKLVRTGSVDLSYSLAQRTRFRVNVFSQRGTLRDRPARHPQRDPHGRGAGHPAAAQRDRQRAQRHRAGHRPDRLGQVHDPGRHHQQDQPRQRHPHHHHRGPDRVPAPAHQVDDQPARGRRGHADLRPRPARRAAPGAEGDPGRRDARRGDDRDRPGGRGDGPPRALHAAHHRRRQDHRPHRRRLPEERGAAGPHALLPGVQVGRQPAPACPRAAAGASAVCEILRSTSRTKRVRAGGRARRARA